MKNTNIKRQAVFPVLMMLVVTALALIGSSFAWFTVANTASVTQITTSAQTDGVQLQLSQDANRYYTRSLKLNTSATGTIIPSTLYQVSTNGKLANTTDTLLKFFDSEVLGHGIQNDELYVSTKLDETVVATNGVLAPASKGENATYGLAGKSYGEASEAQTPTYIVFDLYMHVDRAAELYLFNGTAVTAEKDITDTTSVTDLLKAIRVGFVYLGSGTDGEHIQDETGISGNKSVVIWEPSATEANSTKVATYGIKAQTWEDENNVGEMAAYESNTYTEEVTTYESTELIVETKESDTTSITPLFTTTGECYSKIRVYVWIEGNDPDCVAAIAAQYLRLNLVFFAKEA